MRTLHVENRSRYQSEISFVRFSIFALISLLEITTSSVAQAQVLLHWQSAGTCKILVTGQDQFVVSAITGTNIAEHSPCDPATDVAHPAHYSVRIAKVPGSIQVTDTKTYCMWLNQNSQMAFGPSNCMDEKRSTSPGTKRRHTN